MPTDAELEAMRAMVTATVQSFGKQMEEFNKKAREAASSSGGLAQMNAMIGGMSRALVGPLGIATALYSAGKALTEFADQRLKLRALSTDIGFTVSTIHNLQDAMFEAGKDTEEATRAISSIGSALKDLQARRFGSQLYDDLSKLGPGMREFAKQLLELVDTGDFDKAMKLLQTKWKDFNDRQRILVADAFRVSPSDIDAGMQVIDEHLSARQQEIAERYAKQVRNYRRLISDAWEWALGGALEGISNAAKSITEKAPGFTQGLTGVMPQGQIPQQPQGQGAPWWSSFSFRGSSLGNLWNAIPPLSNIAAAPAKADELLTINRDSSKTLLDIRDILLLQSARGSVGGGGGGGAAGAVGPLGGARSGGGIRLPSDPGGGRPTLNLGGRGGNINMTGGEKSPTGYYYPGSSTSLGGVVGSDSASRGRGQHQGDDFMMPYGSNLYATKDGVVESFGTDNFGQKTMRIRHADGSTTSYLHMSERGVAVGDKVSGGQVIGKSGTANRVPHLHLEMRNPKGELVEPSIEMGLRSKLRQEGSVKGSWFDDRSTASGADASKTAGIALPSREGLGKMHEITTADGRKIMLPQIDVGPAKWTGRGIDFSKPAMDQLGFDPTDKSFSYRRAGETLDKAESAKSDKDAALSATIDFKNMPSWVKTAVDDNGKFKDLRVTRSTPQNGKAGSGLGDYNPWSYE
jgi:murein DD-endopeptidase MepM/ murein hydrolase activator NlpD